MEIPLDEAPSGQTILQYSSPYFLQVRVCRFYWHHQWQHIGYFLFCLIFFYPIDNSCRKGRFLCHPFSAVSLGFRLPVSLPLTERVPKWVGQRNHYTSSVFSVVFKGIVQELCHHLLTLTPFESKQHLSPVDFHWTKYKHYANYIYNLIYGPQNNETNTGLESRYLYEKSVHKNDNVLQMQKCIRCFWSRKTVVTSATIYNDYAAWRKQPVSLIGMWLCRKQIKRKRK